MTEAKINFKIISDKAGFALIEIIDRVLPRQATQRFHVVRLDRGSGIVMGLEQSGNDDRISPLSVHGVEHVSKAQNRADAEQLMERLILESSNQKNHGSQ